MKKSKKGHSKTEAKAQHKAEDIERSRKEKVMDVLIVIFTTLTIISGAVLSFLGISGGLKNHRGWGLWMLFATIVFALAWAFAYIQKQMWDAELKPAPNPDRAYVVVSKGYLAEPPNTGNPPVATLEFENTGKTPAVNMRVSVNYSRIKDKGREQAQRGIMPDIPQNPFESVAVLGSGKIAKFSTPQKEWDNAESKKLWMEGRFVQYLWGEIYYDDIGGGKHVTHFCLSGERPDSHRLGFCPHGNWMEDTDKEPPDRASHSLAEAESPSIQKGTDVEKLPKISALPSITVMEAGKPITVRIDITNQGATTAKDFTCDGWVIRFDEPLKSPLKVPQLADSPSVADLVPRSPIFLLIHTKEALTPEEFGAIREGKRQVRIWLRSRYGDEFGGKDHADAICWAYTHTLNGIRNCSREQYSEYAKE